MRPPTQLETPCIEWDKHRLPTGYGNRKFRGKMMSAHRAAWIEAHGPILGGLYVLHRCDNPPCVNVEHLWLGTQLDNMRDCAAKGRLNGKRNIGADNPSAALTPADVRQMRERYATGDMSYRIVAAEFGVTTMTAWLAINRKTWAEVA